MCSAGGNGARKLSTSLLHAEVEMTTSQAIGIVLDYSNEGGMQIRVRREKRSHDKKAVAA
jgi:hypothetical protein